MRMEKTVGDFERSIASCRDMRDPDGQLIKFTHGQPIKGIWPLSAPEGSDLEARAHTTDQIEPRHGPT